MTDYRCSSEKSGGADAEPARGTFAMVRRGIERTRRAGADYFPAHQDSRMGISPRRPARFVAGVRGRDRRLMIDEGAMNNSVQRRQIGQRNRCFSGHPVSLRRELSDSTELSPEIPPNVLQETVFYLILADSADLFAEIRPGYSRTQNAPIVSADRFRVVMTCAT
ncbi:hypothetical protein [Nocardia cerradoensis]|uniref:hypothetical protein n=1 Tax=Nocardia cerradoensis TaxID=85688 RepID=UPI001427D03B|nr:hypothetical protein [Nocardia cerradoensis]